MSKRRIKHLTALTLWTALQLALMLSNLNTATLVVMLAGLGFLALKTMVGDNVERTHVIDNIMLYLIVTFAVFVGYFAAVNVVPMFEGVTDTTEAVTDALSRGLRFFTSKVEFGAEYVAFAVALFFLRKVKKHPLLNIICGYLMWAVIFIPCFRIFCGKDFATVLTVVPAMMFAVCNIYDYLRCEMISKTGKRWYRILNIVMLIMLMINPYGLHYFHLDGSIEYVFLIDGFKTQTALLLFAGLMAAALVMWHMDKKENHKRPGSDAFIFWNGAWIVAAVYFMSRYYVGYWWLLAILYALGMCYIITALNPTAVSQKSGKWPRFAVPALTVALIALVIAGNKGALANMIVLLLSVAAVAYLWKKTDLKLGKWQDIAKFYTVVLVAIALNAATAFLCFRNIPSNFYVLLGLLVVCTAFVWLLTMESKYIPRRNRYLPLAVAAILLIGCWCIYGDGGSTIRIVSGEGDTRLVSVDARDGKNDLQSIKCYWHSEYMSLDPSEDAVNKEIQLENNIVPRGSGRLRVVAVDTNGIKTEQVFWFHEPDFANEADFQRAVMDLVENYNDVTDDYYESSDDYSNPTEGYSDPTEGYYGTYGY